jgi:hypothetical protein
LIGNRNRREINFYVFFEILSSIFRIENMTKFEEPPIDTSIFDCRQRLVPGSANAEQQQTTNAAKTPSATLPSVATSTGHSSAVGHVGSHCNGIAGLQLPARNQIGSCNCSLPEVRRKLLNISLANGRSFFNNK